MAESKPDTTEEELQCACCDEEKCCPGFWNDPGVPPIFPFSWVFDPKNKYLNDNECAEKFGHCGLRCADKNRKVLMGIALGATVMSIIITGFGCFALASDPEILRLTAWGISYHRDEVLGNGTVVYLGLRVFVARFCNNAPNDNFLDWSDCDDNQVEQFWYEYECGGDFDFGYPCDEVELCQEQAIANQFGAFTTFATLILALNGCLTRIRKIADTNLQKFLGVIPDLFGVCSLGFALANFGFGCYSNQSKIGDKGQDLIYIPGPGYVAYTICWTVALTRTIMHSLVPVPNKGKESKMAEKVFCFFGLGGRCCKPRTEESSVKVQDTL